MAKIVIKKWKCDVCGKESDCESDICATVVPSYAGPNFECEAHNTVDLCQDCSANLRRVISKHFAHIVDNYGTITVRKPE